MFKIKTADEIKKEITAQKKKIKTELELIPARIDEVIKGRLEAEDWEQIQKEIDDKKNIVLKLQERINNINIPSEKNLSIKTEINKLKSKMLELENNFHNEYNNQKNSIVRSISDAKNKISEMTFNNESCNKKISNIKEEINESSILIEELRNKIKELNNKIFDENSAVCPVCGRVYENNKIEEMRKHFDESKISEFKNLNEKGKNLKNTLTYLENQLKENEKNERETREKIENLNCILEQKQNELNLLEIPDLSKCVEYIEINNSIEKLSTKLEKPVDISEIVLDKNNIEKELEILQKRLLKKEIIFEANRRIKELEENQRNLAQKCADLDKIEFKIQEFIKAKVENLEIQINSKFQLVKFQLFEKQINGAEVECCNTTFKGVPFHDMNDEAKLNIGLDIINGLCNHYNIYAPIFIDNRESVTEIIKCKSQIINLIVSENDDKLRVEVE